MVYFHFKHRSVYESENCVIFTEGKEGEERVLRDIGDARLSPYDILSNSLLVSMLLLLLFRDRHFLFFKISEEPESSMHFDMSFLIVCGSNRISKLCFTPHHRFRHTYHMHEKFMWIMCVHRTIFTYDCCMNNKIDNQKKQKAVKRD